MRLRLKLDGLRSNKCAISVSAHERSEGQQRSAETSSSWKPDGRFEEVAVVVHIQSIG